MIPTDFQQASADRILERFKSGQNRVLLADEVGLGKTIVAREVIRKVSDWLRYELRRDGFKVVYICSNIHIAAQNAGKLGIRNHLRVSESRLSMQHLKLYDSLYASSEDQDDFPVQLIPLTPATSFSMTSGTGTINERALMYLHLRTFCPTCKSSLCRLLANGVALYNFDYQVQSYESYIRSHFPQQGADYWSDIHQALEQHFREEPELLRRLHACCQSFPSEEKQTLRILINDLRRVFAEISLNKLEPDLVIMDEFQRFHDLIAPAKDSEEAMLSQKFLHNTDTKILLLSATPYKPYSTLEEIAEDDTADHYHEFMDVMRFLFYQRDQQSRFQTVWNSYSDALCELSNDTLTVLLARKQDAESALYQGICRTERFNSGIIDDSGVKDVTVSAGDILSFDAFQSLMDHILQKKPAALRWKNVPMDYVKSSPYLLSFMDKYKLKQQIQAYYQKHSCFDTDCASLMDYLLLKRSDIQEYRTLPYNNARLNSLSEKAFGTQKYGAELLLWLPPSLPYYTCPGSVFEQNRRYSKTLVFSSWEMVPRMISIMLSYEAERRTIGMLYSKKDNHRWRGYFADEDSKRFGTGRLNHVNRAEDLLCTPSPTLAMLYEPKKYLGCDIEVIQTNISQILQCRLEKLKDLSSAQHCKASPETLLALIRHLDSGHPDIEFSGKIPTKAADILTNMAIASPAVCAYRMLSKACPSLTKQERLDQADQLAKEVFISLFNKPESFAVLEVLYGYKSDDEDFYYRMVLRYCVEGNLQSMLDEYAHTMSGAGTNMVQAMIDGFVKTVNLQIDCLESFPHDPKLKANMRTHFAMGYFNAKTTDQKIESLDRLRKAFNSPFRPFVLSTTSVGQEGLDFHLYCRRVMHWNLPSNPVDLEQREGRVNRYECLAVRQNIAAKYGGTTDWDQMFQEAAEAEKGTNSDLVPHWCLPSCNGEDAVKIERLVPMYPYSLDQTRYERIIKTLLLYRLTLGQPRQEELLANIDQTVVEQAEGQLFMDLSPYRHKKRDF